MVKKSVRKREGLPVLYHKVDKSALGFSLGVISGFGMILMALLGRFAHLGYDWVLMTSSIYPGYDMTFFGIILGGFYGLIDGFIFGWIIGWLYNKFVNKF